MLKGILLTLILCAGVGAGRMLSAGKGRRARLLGELLAGLRVLRLRMLNSREMLGGLLRRSDAALLSELGEEMKKEDGVQECWQALRRAQTGRGGMLDSLTDGDLELLDGLFFSLGGSGREEQNELLTRVIYELEEAQGRARQAHREASRTCTALCGLAGAALCIMLL